MKVTFVSDKIVKKSSNIDGKRDSLTLRDTVQKPASGPAIRTIQVKEDLRNFIEMNVGDSINTSTSSTELIKDSELPDGNPDKNKEDKVVAAIGESEEVETMLDANPGITAEDIAKKWNVSVEEVEKQIKIGMKVETEHSSDPEVQRNIAMDHINEIGLSYYPRLKKAEDEAKAETDHPVDERAELRAYILEAPDRRIMAASRETIKDHPNKRKAIFAAYRNHRDLAKTHGPINSLFGKHSRKTIAAKVSTEVPHN